MLSAVELFTMGVEMGCSDVHIKPGSPPKVRVNGRLISMPGLDKITPRDSELYAHATMNPHEEATFHHNGFNKDYSWELPGVGRFRMNASKTRGNIALVARLLKDQPVPLSELGVAFAVEKLATMRTGVIIVSGATGSGKSTTLSGIIDYINKNKEVNIISIEDPIETLHRDYKSSISQREVGVDVPSFGEALKYALRQDPDVILIGEIRDIDTLRTVLLAADTGHLVVTTLHTTDTAETINRIIGMFPANERHETRRALSSVLKGVVGQILVPTVTGTRVVVNEILLNTPEMTDLIIDEQTTARDIKNLIRTSPEKGMQTFEQALERLVKEHIITLDVAKDLAVEPEYFEQFENDDASLLKPNKNIPAVNEQNIQRPLKAQKAPLLPAHSSSRQLPTARPKPKPGFPLQRP